MPTKVDLHDHYQTLIPTEPDRTDCLIGIDQVDQISSGNTALYRTFVVGSLFVVGNITQSLSDIRQVNKIITLHVF